MEKGRSPLVFAAGALLLIAGIAIASLGSAGSLEAAGGGLAVLGFLAMLVAVVPLLQQSGRND